MTRRDFSERDIHMALDGELPGDERAAYDAWLDANPEMKAQERPLHRRPCRVARRLCRRARRAGAGAVASRSCSAKARPRWPRGIRAGGLRPRRPRCSSLAVLAAISPASTVSAGKTGRRPTGRGGDRRPCHLCRRKAACGGSAGQRQGSSADLAVQPGRPETGGAGSGGGRLPAGRRPAAARRPGQGRDAALRGRQGPAHLLVRHRRIGRQVQGHLYGRRPTAPRRSTGWTRAMPAPSSARCRASSWPRWPSSAYGQLLAGIAS